MITVAFAASRKVYLTLRPLGLLGGVLLSGCASDGSDTPAQGAPGGDDVSEVGAEPNQGLPGAEATPLTRGLHEAWQVAVVYSGVVDQDMRVEVTNSSSEAALVVVEATMWVGSHKQVFAVGPQLALTAGERRSVSVSNAEHGFSSLLSSGEVGRLQIEATMQLSDGSRQQASTMVYIDEAFTVKTSEEVQQLKQGLADAQGLEAFLANPRPAAPWYHPDAYKVQEPEVIIRDRNAQLPTEVMTEIQQRFTEIPIDGDLSAGVSNALSDAAANVSGRICATIGVEWSDDQVGETYLTGGYWSAVGMAIWVRPEGSTTFQGPYYTGPYNGHTIGCTEQISLPSGSNPRIAIQSRARVPRDFSGDMNNHVYIVSDDLNAGPTGYGDLFDFLDATWQSGSNHVSFDAFDSNNSSQATIRATHAAATGLQLLRDQKTGTDTLTIKVRTTTATGGAEASGGEVRLITGDDMRKFLVNHEVGHWAHLTNGGLAAQSNGDYSETGPAPCTSANFNGAFGSREWMTSAFNEGFATFFAAGSFNQRVSGSCRVGWTGGFDCEGTGISGQGIAGFEAKRHLTVCGGDVGHANEWDWVRMFWDVYEDVPYTTISSFLRATANESWETDNAYGVLAHVADGHAINTAWDDNANANGVDICENGIKANNVCCAASCGSCGGSGCGNRPGGSNSCCIGGINDTRGWCADGNAPCKLEQP